MLRRILHVKGKGYLTFHLDFDILVLQKKKGFL